ncbi:MAG: four helix bundle protein [Acidobacteriaceae bacterium]
MWQRSVGLCLALYKLTQSFPRQEMYGLTSQLRRAGVSVASNIAEGFGRRSKSDYRSFLRVARGSVLEIQTQVFIARELQYGEPEKILEAEGLAEEVSRMLWVLIEKLGPVAIAQDKPAIAD